MTDLLGKFFRDLENRLTPIPPNGNFTQIDMAEAKPVPAHPLAKAHTVMIGELARLQVPRLPIVPEPEDFEEVADYLLRVAAVIDVFMADVGAEVRDNALTLVDVKEFENVMRDGIEGRCLHEIDMASEAAREAQNAGDDGDRRYAERQW